jgi:hypothetical protein
MIRLSIHLKLFLVTTVIAMVVVVAEFSKGVICNCIAL